VKVEQHFFRRSLSCIYLGSFFKAVLIFACCILCVVSHLIFFSRMGFLKRGHKCREKFKIISTIYFFQFQVPAISKEWVGIARGFHERWNFSRCCGAIDGKHILIHAPPNCGTEFFNYKSQHSVVLMAVADYNYCFTYIDVPCNGIVSDGGAFQNCSFIQL